MIIIENNKIKEIEPFEPIDMPQDWTIQDTLPYQAMVRYKIDNGEVHLIQIYVKKSERRRGLAKKLFRYLEKKGKVKLKVAPSINNEFGKLLKELKYRPVEKAELDYWWYKK